MATKAIKLSKEWQKRITDALAPLQPEKVILFGSYAWGEPTEDSDIDLYVVTAEDFLPTSYAERMDSHLRAARLLRPVNKCVPIDLIVHTRPMHRAFIRLDSMFAREMMTKGQVLYERNL